MVKGEMRPPPATMTTFKSVYDPDQPEEQRREVTSKVDELRVIAENAKDRDDAFDIWGQAVEDSNKAFNDIKLTETAMKDAGFMTTVTTGMAAKAHAMRSGTGSFDIDEFVTHLLHFMQDAPAPHVHDDEDGEGDEDDEAQLADFPLRWDRIGRRALMKSRRVPVMDFMLGPLEVEQKRRAVSKRTRFEKNKEDEKKPQEITEADITRSENETTKNVAALARLLEQQVEPVNLLKFVINPHDFGQSVENLFYLSFLIRDARCALDYEEGGAPMIFLCEAPVSEDYSEGVAKRQIVMELDMATWRRAIEVFNITESIIPQRPKAETRIGNKWYG